MSIRSERIKSLIEQSKKTYQELEKITGIKKSSLQRYASGVTTKIPLDVIEKLSVTFGVSQEYLMGWIDEPTETQKNSPSKDATLTDGEERWLALYRKFPESSRKLLNDVFDSFEQLPESKQQMALEMIRVALKEKK